MKNLKCGLLGEKLGHSFSPQIHKELADYSYKLFEIPPHDVSQFLSSCDFDCINVTIPYKKTVMPYLDTITDEAKRIGSVNTVLRTKNGELKGYNTDYYGFSYMLDKSQIEIKDKKVLILGSGGACRTAYTVCEDRGAREIVIISRSGENNYQNIDRHYNADVIINTTPVGMYPNNGKAPICLDSFTSPSGVLDMIYNPSNTKLLLDAKRLGIPCINGLYMLVAQAKKACELFLDKNIADSEIERITKKITSETGNIILIGMPGCGKSTLGKLLSDLCHRQVIDTDRMVEKNTGMTIEKIFELHGEAEFRRLEHEAAVEAGMQSGKIIATGGGIVTNKENYEPLCQNGMIFYIDRSIAALPTDGRPISKTTDLSTLYEKRLPLYRSFCRQEVNNDRPPEETAKEILDIYFNRGELL